MVKTLIIALLLRDIISSKIARRRVTTHVASINSESAVFYLIIPRSMELTFLILPLVSLIRRLLPLSPRNNCKPGETRRLSLTCPEFPRERVSVSFLISISLPASRPCRLHVHEHTRVRTDSSTCTYLHSSETRCPSRGSRSPKRRACCGPAMRPRTRRPYGMRPGPCGVTKGVK